MSKLVVDLGFPLSFRKDCPDRVHLPSPLSLDPGAVGRLLFILALKTGSHGLPAQVENQVEGGADATASLEGYWSFPAVFDVIRFQIYLMNVNYGSPQAPWDCHLVSKGVPGAFCHCLCSSSYISLVTIRRPDLRELKSFLPYLRVRLPNVA